MFIVLLFHKTVWTLLCLFSSYFKELWISLWFV